MKLDMTILNAANAAMRTAPGASSEAWLHFANTLGLQADLLPVVSDLTVPIHPASKVRLDGKTPSRIDGTGLAAGLPGWPTRSTSAADIERWLSDPRHGMGLIGRRVKAFDIDIEDEAVAGAMRDALELTLGMLPCRGRPGTGKKLLAFRLAGPMAKRVITTAHGNIELLGDRQQFLLVGRHKSGMRYEWEGGLPAEIPTLTLEEVDAAWSALAEVFGTTESKARAAYTMRPPIECDGVDRERDLVIERWEGLHVEDPHGRIEGRCPWEIEHSDGGADFAMYFPAAVRGQGHAGFKCLHAHCDGRTVFDFLRAIGVEAELVRDEFDVIDGLPNDKAAESVAAAIRNAQRVAVTLGDFWAYLPDHKYIYGPTRAMWPAPSVDGAIRPWPKNPADPSKSMPPSKLLDRERAVQQMTWLPGAPEIITDKVMLPSGWVPRPGARVFNRYLPPPAIQGDATLAEPWLEHLRTVYPDEWDHLVEWFAHRLQRPGEKINHALVLGGAQGIGKDSILVPIKQGVGPSNCEDISPGALMGAFNGFAASVLLVVSEARDLGESDRFKLYEHSKTYICAPPDVLRVNEKHLREYYVPNLCGVIFTTNHRTSGLYLPADDRRHFVTWSEATREQFGADYFPALYRWYAEGGVGHVLAFLRDHDLSGFDPKAAPRKTPAFWAMVQAGEAPESSELRDLIVSLGSPAVLTVADLISEAGRVGSHELAHELGDRKTRARLPHFLDRVGYVGVRSPTSKDGRFGKLTVFGRQELTAGEHIAGARLLEMKSRKNACSANGSNASDFA